MIIIPPHSFLANVFNMLSCEDQEVNLPLLYFRQDAIEGHLFQAARLMTLNRRLAFVWEAGAREG